VQSGGVFLGDVVRSHLGNHFVLGNADTHIFACFVILTSRNGSLFYRGFSVNVGESKTLVSTDGKLRGQRKRCQRLPPRVLFAAIFRFQSVAADGGGQKEAPRELLARLGGVEEDYLFLVMI
jgi:hypothetical protein